MKPISSKAAQDLLTSLGKLISDLYLALRLLSNIKDLCSVELDGEGVYMNTTFGGLAKLILASLKAADSSNIKVEHKGSTYQID